MAHRATSALFLALVAILVPSSFAQDGGSAVEPVVVEAPTPDAIAPGAMPIALPSDYVIGPNDVLRVEVWRDAELTRSVAVRPDGRFTIPLIGEVQAVGLTPIRLQETLREAFSEFVKEPQVTVTVLQVNSRFYTVTGWIAKPGRYPLIRDVTIFEAINEAGGARDFYAKMDEVMVIRENGDRLEFNYEDYVKGKNLDKNPNFLIKNGDTVLIKQ